MSKLLRMFLNRVFAVLFFFIELTNFSQKQKKKDSIKMNKLEEVVVSATRTVRQLSSVPMPITLISKKQIQKVGAVRLSDILTEQTGITTVTDFGGFSGVQMQGLDAEYTLILIDGVPIIGRRSGNIDLDRITVNNIQQIEIVKGPSSSLYGSEALGGVINIITEKPKIETTKGSVQFLSRGGARNELDINTNILFKKKHLGVNASVNLNSSGGFDLSTETPFKTRYPHKNTTGNLKLTYDFSNTLKATISNRFFSENQDAPNVKNTQKDWNTHTEVRHDISDKWKVDYTFYATKFKTKSSSNLNESVFNQVLLRPEIRSQFSFNNMVLSGGIGMNIEEVDRTDFLRKQIFNSPYVFSQLDYKPNKKMNVILGARFDNHSEYQSAISPKLSAKYTFNELVSIKGSLGYGFKAPDFRQLYFNFKNTANGYVVFGVKTLSELHHNFSKVATFSKDLNPENSIGINVGFEIKPLKNLKIQVNVFRNDINDLIDVFDTRLNAYEKEKDEAVFGDSNAYTTAFENEFNIPISTRIFTYQNRARVYTQGVELDVSYPLTNNLRFLGGYQYLEAKDKDEEVLLESDQVFFRKTTTSPSEILTKSDYFGLVNRSKHTANAKLFYENYQHRFSANIRGIYRSKYALFDTNSSQGIIDDFDEFVAGNIQFKLSVEKELLNILKLQFGIDNLFNERGITNKNKTAFTNNDSVLLLGRTY